MTMNKQKTAKGEDMSDQQTSMFGGTGVEATVDARRGWIDPTTFGNYLTGHRDKDALKLAQTYRVRIPEVTAEIEPLEAQHKTLQQQWTEAKRVRDDLENRLREAENKANAIKAEADALMATLAPQLGGLRLMQSNLAEIERNQRERGEGLGW